MTTKQLPADVSQLADVLRKSTEFKLSIREMARSLDPEQRIALLDMMMQEEESAWWASTWLIYEFYLDAKERVRNFRQVTYDALVDGFSSLGVTPRQIVRKLGKRATVEQRINIASWVDELKIDPQKEFPLCKPSVYYTALNAPKEEFRHWLTQAGDNRWSTRMLKSHIDESKRKKREKKLSGETGPIVDAQLSSNSETGEPSFASAAEQNGVLPDSDPDGAESFPYQGDWATMRRRHDVLFLQVREHLKKDDFGAVKDRMSEIAEAFETFWELMDSVEKERQGVFAMEAEPTGE